MKNTTRTLITLMTAFTLAGLLAACTSATAPSSALRGGVLATFRTTNQTFKVFVTRPATIEALFALQRGQATASIPNGRILRGAGAGSHNAPYTWHLDPTDVEMADATIELCDGTPSYVEAHLTEYVDVIGRYCPWGATLVALQDFR
jgi:hypothetical protein